MLNQAVDMLVLTAGDSVSSKEARLYCCGTLVSLLLSRHLIGDIVNSVGNMDHVVGNH